MIILRIILSLINPYFLPFWLDLVKRVTYPGYTLLEKIIQSMGMWGRDYTDQIILAVLTSFLILKYLLFGIKLNNSHRG